MKSSEAYSVAVFEAAFHSELYDRVYIGAINRDNGKENGNYHNGVIWSLNS